MQSFYLPIYNIFQILQILLFFEKNVNIKSYKKRVDFFLFFVYYCFCNLIFLENKMKKFLENKISLETYHRIKDVTNGTFKVCFSLSTDRSDGETVCYFADFVEKVKNIADMLSIPFSDIEVTHSYDESDHEIVTKFVDFNNFSFEETMKCRYNENIVEIKSFDDSDEVCVIVLDGKEKTVSYSKVENLNLKDFVDWE